MLLSLFVGGWLVFASEKNDGTNGVDQVEGGTNVLAGAQGRARSPSAPQGTANEESNGPALRRVRGTRPTVTDDDIARRWRVVSVSSNSVDASVFAFEHSNIQTFPHSNIFLNDDRRPERVYPVSLTLEDTNGLSGTVTLEAGGAGSKLAFDPFLDAPTNRLEFAMGVEEGDWFTSGRAVYLSCCDIGEGRINAAIAFTHGTSCTTSTTFRVIEPLRKLVTTEEYNGSVVNPSRLVWGTNAVLKVFLRSRLRFACRT